MVDTGKAEWNADPYLPVRSSAVDSVGGRKYEEKLHKV